MSVYDRFSNTVMDEKYVISEYMKYPNSRTTTAWCQIMLAGILGSHKAAQDKYPEIFL
jgi:hypothetical protein